MDFVRTQTHRNDFVLAFEGVPAISALTSWQDRLCETISTMEIQPRHRDKPFHACWRHLDLGPTAVNLIASPSQRVVHQPGARSSRHDYDLVYMSRNAIRLRHCGREIEVSEGCMVLIDNSEPYQFESGADIDSITVHFDSQWLNRWIAKPEQLRAKAISGDTGWAAPLCSLLKVIANEGIDSMPAPRPVLGDQIGALLSLIPGGCAEPPRGGVRRYLFSCLQRLIADNFQDPDYSPDKAASDLNISKRHLHGICARENTTFSQMLMAFRLEESRKRLGDMRHRGNRLYDIALDCGFSDPSHFARRFRMAYGVSPTTYRESA